MPQISGDPTADRKHAGAQKEPRIAAVRRKLHTLRTRIGEEHCLEQQVHDLAQGYADILTETLGEARPDLTTEPKGPSTQDRGESMGALGEIEREIRLLTERIDYLETLAGEGLESQTKVYDELLPQ